MSGECAGDTCMRRTICVSYAYEVGEHVWANVVMPYCASRTRGMAEGESHTRMVLSHTRMGSRRLFCCILGAVLPILGNCVIFGDIGKW